jgi:TolB-like protein
MDNKIKAVFWFMTVIFLITTSYAQKKKETIAVLDFNVVSGLSPTEAITLTNSFRSELFETQKYDVLERNEMESILSEQAFTMTGACNSAECAVEIGQLLSAQKMVVGDIGKIGQSYSITIRVVNVSSGKIEQSLGERYKGDAEGLLDIFKVMAQKLAGTFNESTSIWWYVGGVAVVGAGAAAAILLTKEETDKPDEIIIGKPPAEPQVP